MRNAKAKHPVLPSSGGMFQVIFEGKSQMPFAGNGKVTYFCDNLEVAVESPFMRSHEFLGLHFNLLGDLKYGIQDFSGMMTKYQYNLVNIPKGLHNFAVQKGMYASLSVEFSAEYLRVYASRFPILHQFLDTLQPEVPVSISKKHLNVTPEIFPIIHDILNNEFEGGQLKVFLDAKVMDLILECLVHISNADKFFKHPYTKAEIEKIRQARIYILEGLQYNQSVSLLADKIGLDKRKLAAGFKLLFSKTIYEFLIDERLNKAMALIRDTTLPLSQIAFSVSYKNPANFSGAFKKRFGISPSEARKMNKGQSGDDKKNEKE